MLRAALFFALFLKCGAQPLLVNCGGPAVGPWIADQSFTGGTAFVDQAFAADPSTPESSRFQTMRFGASFGYDFKLTSGLYTVVIEFEEPNQTAAAKRLFTVTINGQTSDPVDVFAMSGGTHKATYVYFLAFVEVDHLRISFQGIVGNAIVSSIAVNPWKLIAGGVQILIDGKPLEGGDGSARTVLDFSMGPGQMWAFIDRGDRVQIQPSVNTAGIPIVNAAPVAPACDMSIRGKVWLVTGEAGVADVLQVCMKDSNDNYLWKVIA